MKENSEREILETPSMLESGPHWDKSEFNVKNMTEELKVTY